MMRVLLAEPRGFCAGVEMALRTLEVALADLGAPVYVYHEIVHNRHVVHSFRARGAVFVDDIEDVPRGAVVVFSAHGVSPDVRRRAAERGLAAIDATCPLVAKVHAEVIRRARDGYRVLLIGHAGHDEVVGTVGEAPDRVVVVGSERDVAALDFGAAAEPVAFVTQTTLARDEADAVAAAISARFPGAKPPPSHDICYATTNRQHAVRVLGVEADVVLVVGSRNSSNSARLAEVARTVGVAAHLVDGAADVARGWFRADDTVLMTAGASAPEYAVRSVLEFLREHFDVTVEPRHVIREEQHFADPVSLNVVRRQRAAGPVGNNGSSPGTTGGSGFHAS